MRQCCCKRGFSTGPELSIRATFVNAKVRFGKESRRFKSSLIFLNPSFHRSLMAGHAEVGLRFEPLAFAADAVI
jgi:hypothetical protein